MKILLVALEGLSTAFLGGLAGTVLHHAAGDAAALKPAIRLQMMCAHCGNRPAGDFRVAGRLPVYARLGPCIPLKGVNAPLGF